MPGGKIVFYIGILPISQNEIEHQFLWDTRLLALCLNIVVNECQQGLHKIDWTRF